jgi:hypothetical protein
VPSAVSRAPACSKYLRFASPSSALLHARAACEGKRDGMADEISVQAPVSQCERWLFCGERWMCRCDATERWMCRCDAESCGVKRGGVKPLHFVGTTWSLAMFS